MVGEPSSHMPTRVAAVVSEERVFPSFMRRYIDMAGSSGPGLDQPRALPEGHFVPRELRGKGAVTPPITQPLASVIPVVGSICPTCQRRVPTRQSSAERQRAYRKRKREQGKLIVP